MESAPIVYYKLFVKHLCIFKAFLTATSFFGEAIMLKLLNNVMRTLGCKLH